ncbi:MAG: PH domain-containing protein [Rhodobacteraceae bacterium]|jgi:hypothetical protein|nr:PH domain-containing protein [Paracoccaceae bacterium]
MAHDDLAVEPVRGLPERLPPGETILWQGRPDAWRLAVEALSLRWVAGYFLVMAVWQAVVAGKSLPFWEAVRTGSPFVVMGASVCAVLYLVALVQARSTVYTVTNRRVAMRIGAALTITLNLPFRWIGSASLDLRRGGTGTIALALTGTTRLSYLGTWPHVRPWAMRRTEPALRCIPDARRVADLLAEAAEARLAEPRVTRRDGPPALPVAVAAE